MDQLISQKVNGHKIASVFNDGKSKKLVIFCHGFRGSSIGPNRFFVRLSEKLKKEGVSSLRFDQYGSGNSEGDFMESSFNDWVSTTKEITQKYLNEGFQVALLGQSMGGATVIITALQMGQIASVVAWTPGLIVDPPNIQGEYMEEGGQRVSWKFWQEAHEANVIKSLQKLSVPVLIFLATNDEFISEKDMQVLKSSVLPNQEIETLQGHKHSTWNYDQAESVLEKTKDFLIKNFK